MKKNTQHHAFSLVELSIVLVILGLLVGGILAGQSLIRASELRAVSAEYQRWTTANAAFRDKYFAMPGDFLTATSFWGSTVNGNGDGLIDTPPTPGVTGEVFTYWQHLALAGMVEGTYSGVAGSGNNLHTIAGVNSPASKVSSGAWTMRNLGIRNGVVGVFNGTYSNTMIIGGTRIGQADQPIFTGQEAWNIDTKLDDGMPASGKIVGFQNYNCAIQTNGSAVTNDAAGSAMLTAVYNLPSSALNCALLFPRAM